jgi:uncharacterized protein (DUF2062 family)
VFRRRQPLPLFRWLHGLVWPRTGWRRAFAYYVKRLTRLTGTPHNIAAGVACGVAISFTPFVGLHIILGCLLALIVRGNLLAVVVGTLVGNPWTFPFIWLAAYEVGHILLGGTPSGVQPEPWTFHDVTGYVSETAAQVTTLGPIATVKRLVADFSVVAKPIVVGAIPLGTVAGLLTYFPLVRLIAAYQEARRRRREVRRHRRDGAAARLKAAGAPTDAGAA